MGAAVERKSGKRRAAAIGAAISVLLSGLVVYWGLSEQAKYERRAEQQAYEDARQTEKDIHSRCFGSSSLSKRNCSVDAHREERRNEREEQDLVAQKTSALWTFLMGAAAIAGVLLSTIGVWLVYITFEETRRGNELAKGAAERSAKEAEATRRHLIRTERAVIRVIGMTGVSSSDREGWVDLILTIQNEGRSNAWNLERWIAFRPDAKFPSKLESTPRLDEIIRAGGEPTRLPKFKLKLPRKLPAYLFGRLTYYTAHEARFYAYFIYRFDVTPNQDSYGELVGQPADVSDEVEIPSDT